MPINATCQQCGATLPVPDEYAGKAVRCGGCQGVVNVPAAAQSLPPQAVGVPVARARPVAVPVAAKERPKAKAEVPLPKARKARDDDEPESEDDDQPKARPTAARRPIAKRRRESILTPTAFQWLTLFLICGAVGLGVLAYAAWGSSRRNDGTALIPPEDNPAPNIPEAARPLPALPQPNPVGLAPPDDVRNGVDPQFRGNPFDPNARPKVQNLQPPRLFDLPFRASTNAVLAKMAEQYAVTASTQFDPNQWAASKAFDNTTVTSWYSGSEGPAAKPWVQVTFTEPVAVSRVVILGNRDQYGNTYTVTQGTITLLDRDDKVLVKADLRGVGAKSDFDFAVAHPRVHAVRFTATASNNASMCVAVGEFQLE